ncbi:MAG: hypothetical protein V1873_04625 [Verrucomicrobiota bacterium]
MEQNPSPAAQDEPRFDVFVAAKFFDRLLAGAKRRLTPAFFESSTARLTRYGHCALLLAAAVGLLSSIVITIKHDTFSAFVSGLGWVLLLLVLQYTAVKFESSGDTFVKGNPSQIASPAFLDCVALANFIVGWLFLLGFLVIAIQAQRMNALLFGACLFVLCEYLACLAMNPALLNISAASQAGAGEEAVGIIMFLMKAFLRLVPVAFGTGLVLGALRLVVDCVQLLRGRGDVFAAIGQPGSVSLTVAAAALPFFGYILFVLCYLHLDVIRAILAIPAKLDESHSKRSH